MIAHLSNESFRGYALFIFYMYNSFLYLYSLLPKMVYGITYKLFLLLTSAITLNIINRHFGLAFIKVARAPTVDQGCILKAIKFGITKECLRASKTYGPS